VGALSPEKQAPAEEQAGKPTSSTTSPLDLLLRYGIPLFIVLLSIYFAISAPNFLTIDNFLNVLRQISINTIVAVGMTFVIITAGIDLSVGSIVALAAVICTGVMKNGITIAHLTILPPPPPSIGVPLGIIIGLLLGAFLGAFNGFFITRFLMPPFVVTLAMMTIARGLAFIYTGGFPVPELPNSFITLGSGYIGPIPIPVIIMAVIALIAHYILTRTTFGRYVFAIGGNEEAARLSGININKVKLMVYTLSGFLAALAGIILAARLGSGDPKTGQMYELNAIAACVLGGTSLMGGKGNIGGTFLGALLIGIIDNGLVLMRVSTFYQYVVKGGIILAAVLLDKVKEMRKA
jgi:ribose transport system permease protein